MRTLPAIAALVAVMLAAGCGGGGDANTPEGAVEAYFGAVSQADGETACGLLTDDALAGSALAGAPAGGADCVSAVNALPQTESSEVTTEVLEETAGNATVKVTIRTPGQQGSPFAVQLVKDGDQWKIDALAVSATQP